MIAKIAVSAAVFAMDKPYDYEIPAELPVQIGVRVIVPFGAGNRQIEGIVLALEEGQGVGLKSVIQVLDSVPLLDDRGLRLAAFLRERYFCTFYDAVKAILPAGVWFQEQERYRIACEDWHDQVKRQKTALAVMQTIDDLGGEAEASVLRKQFEEEALSQALRYLLRKKLLTLHTDRRRTVRDHTERILLLTVSAEEALDYAARKKRSAPAQAAVLELMATVGECAAKEVSYFTGASSSTFHSLERAGYLCFRQKESLRITRVEPEKLDGPLVLSEEQETCYQGLVTQMEQEKPGVALLYGVTGSGKTSVYIKLICQCLAKGKSAILLVPEIALTPQLLALFSAHFGEQVAVLHSSLRITERYDTYKRICSGAAKVILGTRSAVFAPAQNLGILIVDEEQEHTYKSENSPRYHAREVAIFRGTQSGAMVLLGSATPSIETMYRANRGIYQLYRLRGRFNQMPLPPVQIVDMKEEFRQGNGTAISEALLLALRENIDKGQQSILYLNRRGSSRMLVCVDCGFVPTCPGCSVDLTYHHANGRMMCHYCGHSRTVPTRCPECGGHFKTIGFGTQKVEEQLSNLLPGVPVLRMDADTVSAVNSHEKLLKRFTEEKIPILLGTQMVAKGLNFENVTLVGVIDADMSLYVGSYRAAETTFCMTTQVVGRAGRGSLGGRAMVQTMTPRNHVVVLAAEQDYDGFYESEIPLRRLRGCPPFRDLITLTFHGMREELVYSGARRFRELLLAHLQSPHYAQEQVTVLGPAPSQIAKLNYHYRCRLTLSCQNTRALRQLLSHLMRQFLKSRENRHVGLYADVNSNE